MAITAKVETITKEVALKYLESSDGNRPASQHHLADLVARQRRQEWIYNGDTIRFDKEGCLRDGQHRLKMVVMSEIPIETVVVRGIDPKAYITVDTGKSRNLSDVLSIEKYENSYILAGAVRYLRGYVSQLKRTPSGFSHEQQLTLLKKHKGLVDSVDFYLGLNIPKGATIYQSQTVAWHYLFSRVSPEASNDFIERLVTGLRLEERTDPVYQLKYQLIANLKARVHGADAYQVFCVGIFAWNAKQDGREQKVAYKIPKSIPPIKGFPKELMEGHQLNLEEPEETNGNNS